MRTSRIYVGGLFHEANSFSALTTGLRNHVITEAAAMLAKARSGMMGLSGIVRHLEGVGADVLTGFSAVAPPGGRIERSVYERFRTRFLEEIHATQPDAICLDLHGASQADGVDDLEGDLLSAIRAKVGCGVPIAVSLDLHAYMTEAMFDAADILIACKENPHTDYHLAGEKAARLLMERLDGTRMHMTAVWVPLIFGSQMETGRGPLFELHKLAAEIATQPGIFDVSIYNTTTLLDAEHAGQCLAAVHTPETTDNARFALQSLAQLFWEKRDDFAPSLPDLASALARRTVGVPLIIGDQGDRVLAGTPGDGSYCLNTFLTQCLDVKALVPVTDPTAVCKARKAGCGAMVHLRLGGSFSAGVAPVEAEWRVIALGNGEYANRGPYLANEPATLGVTALLRRGNLTVLATSMPGFTQDPEAFESQGARIADFDVVVCKSGYHFRLSFEGIGDCVVADTPGISNYRPGLIPFQKRTDLYPECRLEKPEFRIWSTGLSKPSRSA